MQQKLEPYSHPQYLLPENGKGKTLMLSPEKKQRIKNKKQKMPLPGLLSSKPPCRASPHRENDREYPSLKFEVHKT